jgi:hypothetical protein
MSPTCSEPRVFFAISKNENHEESQVGEFTEIEK